MECAQPSKPSEPKMTPGRKRTLSAPFNTDMLSLPYSGFLIFSLFPLF
jgi:hypothetical protein